MRQPGAAARACEVRAWLARAARDQSSTAAQGAARRSLFCINSDSFPIASFSLNFSSPIAGARGRRPGSGISSAADQVHLTLVSVASVIPEVAARKVFDDLPHWDEDATWDDEEMGVHLSYPLQSLGDLILSEGDVDLCPHSQARCDAHNVFDEVLSEVLWDEDEQDIPNQHGLLKKLALGADTLAGENKMYAEQNQVPIQASTVWDTAVQELLDDRSPPDVIWDEELVHELHIVDKDVLLEPAEEEPMQGATNASVLSEGDDLMMLHFGNGVSGASQESADDRELYNVGIASLTAGAYLNGSRSFPFEFCMYDIFAAGNNQHFQGFSHSGSLHDEQSLTSFSEGMALGLKTCTDDPSTGHRNVGLTNGHYSAEHLDVTLNHMPATHQDDSLPLQFSAAIDNGIWDDEFVHGLELNGGSVVLDEMPHEDIIWDEDLYSDLDMHHGLLQRSAYLVNEVKNKSVINNKLTQDVIIRPWDPRIITATAWGQAVFRGGGNVMTRMWPRRSPRLSSPIAKSQPKRSPSPELLNSAIRTREKENRNSIRENRERRRREKEVVFLLPIPEILPSRSALQDDGGGRCVGVTRGAARSCWEGCAKPAVRAHRAGVRTCCCGTRRWLLQSAAAALA